MILSRILMVLALAVLAILLYFTMFPNCTTGITSESSTSVNTGASLDPAFAPVAAAAPVAAPVAVVMAPDAPTAVQRPPKSPAQASPDVNAPSAPAPERFSNNGNIRYEKFENAEGVYDASYGAAPFGSNQQINTTDYAQVKYTGLVNANPNDIIQIEGTDLLTAPLVDNMLYTNSISNTNRNASHDLRGDLSLTFNENYTPFYSSVIYGAPLSQKIMTLGSLDSSGPVGPTGPFNKGLIASA